MSYVQVVNASFGELDDVETVLISFGIFPALGLAVTAVNLIIVVVAIRALNRYRPTTILCSHKNAFRYILNLALSDTLAGSVVAFAFLYPAGSHSRCLFKSALAVTSGMVSALTIILISMDRYLYIIHPMSYQTWMSHERVKAGIVASWLMSLLIGCAPFLWHRRPWPGHCLHFLDLHRPGYILFLALLHFVAMFPLVFLYVAIFKTARTQREQLKSAIIPSTVGIPKNFHSLSTMMKFEAARKLSMHLADMPDPQPLLEMEMLSFQRQLSSNRPTLSEPHLSLSMLEGSTKEDDFQNGYKDHAVPLTRQTSMHSRSRSQGHIREHLEETKHLADHHPSLTNFLDRVLSVIQSTHFVQEVRAARTAFYILGSFIFSWLPYCISSVVYVASGCYASRCVDLNREMAPYFLFLGMLNSLFNPFIYAWGFKEFRTHGSQCCKRARRFAWKRSESV